MADSKDGDFLSRWSRRKRGEEIDRAEAPRPSATPAAPTAAVPDAADEDQGDPEVVARLPDIDSLDDSSDFKVFLQKGVPAALRRQALRKLWRVNPVLANLDGLNNYDEDYTKLHVVGRTVKTLYEAGKGFLSNDPEFNDPEAEPETVPPRETAGPEAELPEASPSNDALATPADEVASESPAAGKKSAESTTAPRGSARRRRWGTGEPHT